MDPLNQLTGPATDLLDRVDRVLAAAGAPDGHPIWSLLRRLRVLPGDAARAVCALRAAPLVAAADAARQLLAAYDEACVALAAPVSWQGPAAEAFAGYRDGLTTYLAGDGETLIGRAAATASYADALAEWVTDARLALARTLADVLASAEAVAVVTATTGGAGPIHAGADTGGVPVVLAAAEIGARVLGTIAEAYHHATVLSGRWAPELAALAYRVPEAPAHPLDTGRIVH